MDPKLQEQTIRLNLAMQLKDKTVEELDAVFNWVMGPKTTIIPAANITVLK